MKNKLITVIALLSLLLISGCAASGAKFSSEASSSADKGTVIVYRPYKLQSGALYANVYIDGQNVGKLRNSGFLKLEVGNGTHTLKVGSQTKSISISNNEKKYFKFVYGWDLFAAVDIVSDTLYEVDEQAALEEIKDTSQSI